MKFTKTITKLALASALLGSVGTTTTALNTTTVSAELLPAAKTKDYNKLLQLSKEPGKHYVGTRKFYASWVPGNNVGNAYHSKPYKLANITMDPGREWATAVGAGYIHGKRYVIEHQHDDNEVLVPAEFYHVPYGFRFKKNHAPVECYYGSLAESWNGYDEYSGEYEGVYTKNNTIYSDHKDGHRKLTMAIDGQHNGKNPGFFIGQTPIHMNDGHDYYPVYSYTTSDVLGVVYIRTEDIDQFKPAKVTYKYIGTLNKTKGKNYYHSFKPYRNRVDF